MTQHGPDSTATVLSMKEFRERARNKKNETCLEQLKSVINAANNAYLKKNGTEPAFLYVFMDGDYCFQTHENNTRQRDTDLHLHAKIREWTLVGSFTLGPDIDNQLMHALGDAGLHVHAVTYGDLLKTPVYGIAQDKPPTLKNFEESVYGYPADADAGMTPFETYMRDAYAHYRALPDEFRKRWLVTTSRYEGRSAQLRFTISDEDPRTLAARTHASRFMSDRIIMVLDLAHEGGFAGAWPHDTFGTCERHEEFLKEPALGQAFDAVVKNAPGRIGSGKTRRPTPDFIQGVVDGNRHILENLDLKDVFLNVHRGQLVCNGDIFVHGKNKVGTLKPHIKHIEEAYKEAVRNKHPYLLVYFHYKNNEFDSLYMISYAMQKDAARQYNSTRNDEERRPVLALRTDQFLLDQILNGPVAFKSWKELEGNPLITDGVINRLQPVP